MIGSPGLAVILAGLGAAAFGFYVNRWRTYEDPATGDEMKRKERNGFFWIPLQYWGIVITVLGIVVMVNMGR